MNPIGAYCNILFDDGDRVDGYYISFGSPPRIDEEARIFDYRDSYGVDDDRIFYYADGEEDLKELMKDNPHNDFKILSYELEYAQ